MQNLETSSGVAAKNGAEDRCIDDGYLCSNGSECCSGECISNIHFGRRIISSCAKKDGAEDRCTANGLECSYGMECCSSVCRSKRCRNY